MRPLEINLATRPFRNNVVVGWVVTSVAIALALATIFNLYVFLNYGSSYQQLLRQEADDKRRLQSLITQERKLSKEIQARDFAGIYTRGRFAQDLILKRSFSWTLLFNRLEGVVPPEVMMTAIRPNITGEGITVRVDGMAKSSDGLIHLEENLLRNAAFVRVYPNFERPVNPSRPEINFSVNFDYLPAAPPQAPVPVAGAGDAPASAPADAGAATATAAVPGGGEQGAPAKQPTDGTPAEPPKGVVGRDGRPRTDAVLALRVAAPGGVYPPLPEPPAPPAPGAAPRSSPAPQGASPRPTPKASAARPGAGAAAGSPGGTLNGGPPPDTAPPAAGATAAAPPLRVLPKGEPNLPDALSPARRRTGSGRDTPATPAVRLDVPLGFVNRPVAEIYDALGRAHSVRFELEAGVDGTLPVSANLRGKSIDEAIAVLEKAARHRVTRGSDGVYRVIAHAGGQPVQDAPVQEEDLPPSGGRP